MPARMLRAGMQQLAMHCCVIWSRASTVLLAMAEWAHVHRLLPQWARPQRRMRSGPGHGIGRLNYALQPHSVPAILGRLCQRACSCAIQPALLNQQVRCRVHVLPAQRLMRKRRQPLTLVLHRGIGHPSAAVAVCGHWLRMLRLRMQAPWRQHGSLRLTASLHLRSTGACRRIVARIMLVDLLCKWPIGMLCHVCLRCSGLQSMMQQVQGKSNPSAFDGLCRAQGCRARLTRNASIVQGSEQKEQHQS